MAESMWATINFTTELLEASQKEGFQVDKRKKKTRRQTFSRHYRFNYMINTVYKMYTVIQAAFQASSTF